MENERDNGAPARAPLSRVEQARMALVAARETSRRQPSWRHRRRVRRAERTLALLRGEFMPLWLRLLLWLAR